MTPDQQIIALVAAVIGAFVTAFSKQFFKFMTDLVKSNKRPDSEVKSDEAVALDALMMPERVKETHQIVFQIQKDAEVNKVYDEHSRSAIVASADAVKSIALITERSQTAMLNYHKTEEEFRSRVDIKLDKIITEVTGRD